MSIPFTQYLIPDGRTKEVTVNMSVSVEQTAHVLIEKGCHFDVEILSTGQISMTCERDDDCFAHEICSNDDEQITDSVEKLIKSATLWVL